MVYLAAGFAPSRRRCAMDHWRLAFRAKCVIEDRWRIAGWRQAVFQRHLGWPDQVTVAAVPSLTHVSA